MPRNAVFPVPVSAILSDRRGSVSRQNEQRVIDSGEREDPNERAVTEEIRDSGIEIHLLPAFEIRGQSLDHDDDQCDPAEANCGQPGHASHVQHGSGNWVFLGETVDVEQSDDGRQEVAELRHGEQSRAHGPDRANADSRDLDVRCDTHGFGVVGRREQSPRGGAATCRWRPRFTGVASTPPAIVRRDM